MTAAIHNRFAALLGAALLVAMSATPRLVAAHDFGGNTSAGTAEPQQSPPPCDSNMCCAGSGSSNRSEAPISYWNGGESFELTDVVVRGVYPIEVRRKYDSQSEYDSPLGYGWVFLHDRRLYEYPDGSVVLRYGCGARDRFVFSGGAFVSPAGGVLGTLVEQGDGSFKLSYVNGGIDFYDSQGRLTASQRKDGSRHEYTYDSRGKLPLTGASNAGVDPNAPMVVALNYRLTRIDERAPSGVLTGRFVTFAYNETTGRLTGVTSDDGRSVTYQHDLSGALTKGNLVQVNGLDGVVATYGYTDPYDPHNLTSITPAAGRTPVVNVYDDQDRVVTQTEGTRRIDFNYQIPLTKTVVTKTIKDAAGLNPYTAVTTYEFESSGRITKVTDALGHESRYQYDSAKALTRRERWQKVGTTLALLQATDFTYDGSGRKLSESVTLDSGEVVTTTWTYDHDWVASQQTVSSAAPSKLFRTEYTFYYGGDGRPTAIQSEKRRKDDGSFQTTMYTYDGRNRLLTTTLPDAVKIVNTYTGDHVTKVAYEVGGTELAHLKRTFDYDGEGNRTKEWDARGNLTQYGYDDAGRLISRTDALGQQTLYTYTNDLLTQVEIGKTIAEGEGQVTKLNYDARGRLTSMQRKDDAGTWQTFETYALDSEGRRLTSTDAVSRTTTFTYDLLGRVATVKDPLNKTTTFSYDAAGNRTSVTDALTRMTAFEYDDLNRQTAMVEGGISPSPRTEYTYDAVGNLTSVKDAENRTTLYANDALSRRTSVIQPLGQTVQYVYDSRDRLDYVVNARGNKLDYGYETWGALKEEKQYATTSSGTAVRTIGYGYDLDGNVTSVTDDAVQAGASYAMTYDVLGRLYDETVKYLPGGDRVLNHRYDRYGNRSGLTLNDGAAIAHSYVYDKRNRLTSATLAGTAITLGYYANDDRQSVTLPGSVTRSYTYKANGPVDTITVTGPSGPLAQYAYAYDDVLNVDTLTTPDGVHDYGYDGLNRLTSAAHPTSAGLTNEAYAYDKVGNREDPGNPTLYGYDNNHRITTSPGLTYTFDADGSVATRSDGATFTHDYRSRLTQFVKGATNASYLYDAAGRRIKKTVNGTATWFLWDGASVLAEYSGAGTRTQRYAYLAGDYAPAQLEDANGTVYVHADHLDAPRLATDATGVVVWRARYEAFGTVDVQADPDGNGQQITINHRFPGQYADPESGSYYNYFRNYDPATGRYTQADPIGQAGGVNPFTYANGNPLAFIDVAGLLPKCETFQEDVKSRSWDERRVSGGFRVFWLHLIPVGPKLEAALSLRIPRKPPIDVGVEYEVQAVWLYFKGRETVTTYEQVTAFMVSFCTVKEMRCGREVEIPLPVSRYAVRYDPVVVSVVETDIYLYSEPIKKLN